MAWLHAAGSDQPGRARVSIRHPAIVGTEGVSHLGLGQRVRGSQAHAQKEPGTGVGARRGWLAASGISLFLRCNGGLQATI